MSDNTIQNMELDDLCEFITNIPEEKEFVITVEIGDLYEQKRIV